jgi:acetoin:2,6-dichlorophenolindophenol oxidoreductase subunit alpha
MLHTLKKPMRESKDLIFPVGMKEQYIKAFKWMLLARTVEQKLASLWHASKIAGGVYLGKGQEAISTATAMMLKPGDIFGPLIRDQAGRLAFGEPIVDVFRNHLGSRTGPMQGRDGNVHRGRPRDGYYSMISHLGTLVSVVAGALMARRFKGDTAAIGATSIGDGGTSTGSFHEALNLAAVEKLPLVVVVTNNQYAFTTPTARQFACKDLVDRAIGYGVKGFSMDGTDLGECLEIMSIATDRARAGLGPQLVVASCLRLNGHAEHDDAAYMDRTLFATPLGRDCNEVAEFYLLETRWADGAQIETWKKEAKQLVEEAAAQALREPVADPTKDDWRPYATRRIAEALFPQ